MLWHGCLQGYAECFDTIVLLLARNEVPLSGQGAAQLALPALEPLLPELLPGEGGWREQPNACGLWLCAGPLEYRWPTHLCSRTQESEGPAGRQAAVKGATAGQLDSGGSNARCNPWQFLARVKKAHSEMLAGRGQWRSTVAYTSHPNPHRK